MTANAQPTLCAYASVSLCEFWDRKQANLPETSASVLKTKGWSKKKKEVMDKCRSRAFHHLPFMQLTTRSPHFKNCLMWLLLWVVDIKRTCSNLPRETTVNKMSVLNLSRKGSCAVLSHPQLLPYSIETIKDSTSKLQELHLFIATSPFLRCQLK